jgi:hypothetical protein
MRRSDSDQNKLLDAGGALNDGNAADARHQVLEGNSLVIVELRETTK